MADVAASFKDWSTTVSSNAPADATTIGAGLADNFQQIQATVRTALGTKGTDKASAGTVDLSDTDGLFHDVTGTTTITSFGTASAGIWKVLKFEGALTLTHNATSLILLLGANRTTVNGDVGCYVSEGSGNWREVFYMPVNTQLTNSGVKFAATQAASSDVNTLDDYEEGTWTPGVSFGNGTTGITYTSQLGHYTKIGRLVTCDYFINLSNKGSSTGTARITGLPFTTASTVLYVAAILWTGMTSTFVNLMVVTDQNLTTATIWGATAATANLTARTEADFSNSTAIQGTLIFNV